MIGRIVEIAENHRHLSVYRGFLVVTQTGSERQELARIPLDDIVAVIASGHGFSYTNNLLVALSERGAPFVVCAANHSPVAMLLPTCGNFEQSRRIAAQAQATKPLKKRLWSSLVKAKLSQQAATLESAASKSAPLKSLVGKVRSGDPANVEAQGAKRYWPLLFGKEFRRAQDGEGINSLLNYGYTVFRAGCARAVIAAGLHPSLGLHHSHAGNPTCLIDDLIEPFRPFVDFTVWQLARNGRAELNANTKRSLAETLHIDILTSEGLSPASVCMQNLATSLALTFLGKRQGLDLPLPTRSTESPGFYPVSTDGYKTVQNFRS